jgi:hypothetical protein
MTMATSLALANPKQYDNVMSLLSVVQVPIANEVAAGVRGTRAAPRAPASDWTTRSFVRRDCFEPVEGSAHFYDLTAHRSPPPVQGDFLLGQDCSPAGDDAED